MSAGSGNGKMSDRPCNVLVLCTGNSARSILGEALFNALGQGRFKAYSAGSRPAGKVNPFALEWLQANGYGTEGLRSKSWDEFAAGPQFDFIFTVCDNAAGEACPLWQGNPATAHWGIPDPAAAAGDDAAKRAAFNRAAEQLTRRIRMFMSLPLEKLDLPTLKQELAGIGRIED